jgi:hypothetical protein
MTMTLRIDDVPTDVVERLTERAAAHHQTLQEMLLDLVTREALQRRAPLTRTQAHRIVEAARTPEVA